MMASNKVRVIVRTKPTAKFAHDLINFQEDDKTININLPKNSDQLHGFINNQQKNWSFKMDQVLHNAGQEEVYNHSTRNFISPVLDGYNATVMAFGQTGAGKTYTMTGPGTNYGLRGIIPRTVSHLFREIDERREHSIDVRVSYFEIYNDNIRDLLSTLDETVINSTSPLKNTLSLSEDERGNVFVKGLSVKLVRNEEEALNLLFEGEMNRSIGEHSLNLYSSRSHCIFTLHIDSRSRVHSTSNYTVSKLTLVDLAGSERLTKIEPVGTMRETIYINKSLSFLEQVTLALSERNRSHIPYRQSKLTHLLKNSIGGNCSTVMIANVWVEAEQIEETISTLKFSTRMMHVCNNPKKSILQDQELLIKEYKDEIDTLRMELTIHDTLVGKSSTSYEPISDAEVKEIDHQIKLYLDGAIPELEINNYRQVKETFSRFKQCFLASEVPISISPYVPPATAESTAYKRSSTVSRKTNKTKSGMAAPSIASDSDQDGGYQEKVGDSDGTGFSMGVAPLESKHHASPVAAIKKANQKSSPTIAFNIKNRETTTTKDEVKISLNFCDDRQSSNLDSEYLLQTPPNKEEEFEKFKKESGRKIHSAFINNKEVLSKKNKECIQYASEINKIKKEIDTVRECLKEHKEERESGILRNLKADAGEIVIGEEEFSALSEFKRLKVEYRKKYQALLAAQEIFKALHVYVEKSRSRLLAEFKEWYRISYVGMEATDRTGDMENESNSGKRMESELEKFERLQDDLLKKDPSTTAFYHAQLRTERRSYTRKPGDSAKNKPPEIMTFN